MDDAHPRRRATSAAMDAAVVLFCALLGIVAWYANRDALGPWTLVLPLVSAGLLWWRRTRPVPVLVAVGLCAVVDTAFLDLGALLLPLAVSLYTVISLGRRRWGLAAGASAALVLVGVLLLRGESPDSGVVAVVPLLLALAVVVGLVVAARRAELATARDRVRRAEETRDAQSRRAVAEERLRIARELHDVLAHQVAVVGVQVGVAEALLVDDPDVAREALVTVRTASQDALRELASLLELLRRGDGREPDADGERTGRAQSPGYRGAPAPSLTRLDDLLEAARDTGLRVEVTVDGAPRPLAPVVDLAAYRAVQEALTNAHKHGTGSARLTLAWSTSTVAVVVSSPVSEASGPGGARAVAPSTGLGLVGMRERVESVGGTLDVGPDGREFVVRAVLPAVLPSGKPADRSSDPGEGR